jgi:hypothetical protein
VTHLCPAHLGAHALGAASAVMVLESGLAW